jgi:hypothetical protein
MDFDQSGVSRQWTLHNMGPSVGWVMGPAQNIQPITVSGTYVLDPSTTLVQVNVAGSVTITLPSSSVPAAGALAQPGLFVGNPITIVDVGGFAARNNITILPNNAAETVMGLSSIKIATNYGGFTLQPFPIQRTWTSISP